MSTPVTFPLSTASFRADTFNYDALLASECISQTAKIAPSLGVLKRGQVLYGPAVGTPITSSTNLTTSTASGAPRAILAQDIDTGTGAAVTGLVYTQGKFIDLGMTFTAAGAASDAALLWDVGIYVLTEMGRSGQLIPMISLPATGGVMPNTNVTPPQESQKLREQEVEAIHAATRYPFDPAIHQPRAPQAPWADAAFGEARETPVQEAQAEADEKAGDLEEKQRQEREKLQAEVDQKFGALAEKQFKEREQLNQQTRDANQKARDEQARQAAEAAARNPQPVVVPVAAPPPHRPPEKGPAAEQHSKPPEHKK
jgi:hypothetical protein